MPERPILVPVDTVSRRDLHTLRGGLRELDLSRGPSVSEVQHPQTLFEELNGLRLGHVRPPLVPHDGESHVRAVACSHNVILEDSAVEVSVSDKGLRVGAGARNNERVPQRLHLGALVVHDTAEKRVDLGGGAGYTVIDETIAISELEGMERTYSSS